MEIFEFITNNLGYSIAVAVFVIIMALKFCVPRGGCACGKRKSILEDYDNDVELTNVAPDDPKDIPTDRESSEEEKEEEQPPTVYVDMGMQTEPPVKRNNIVTVSINKETINKSY